MLSLRNMTSMQASDGTAINANLTKSLAYHSRPIALSGFVRSPGHLGAVLRCHALADQFIG
jgi:hypothetical protein